MEEQTKLLLENKLIETISWLEGAVKSGKDFMVEQTPLYIQELLAWNFWISLIYFTISLLFLSLPTYSLIYALRNKFTFKDEDIPKEPVLVFGGLVCLFIGAPLFCHNLDWLQIKLAPRVWLVEYLQGML